MGAEFQVDGAQVSRWATTNAKPELRQIMAMWKSGPRIHPSKWLEEPQAEDAEPKTGTEHG